MRGEGFHLVASAADRFQTLDDLSERDFMREVWRALVGQSVLAPGERIDLISRYNAVQLPEGTDRRVAVYLGGEDGVVPLELLETYDLIFASYSRPPGGPSGYRAEVFPFPLGYCAGRKIDGTRALVDRTYDFCFVGTLNVHRLALLSQFAAPSFARIAYRLLHQVRGLPRTQYVTEFFKKHLGVPALAVPDRYFVHFGQRWSEGVSERQYCDVVAHSKVVACPRGWSSAETFRHYEAAMAGCVVLTETLPPAPFYAGAPFVEMPTWTGLQERVSDIVGQIHAGAITAAASASFYRECMSPEATAAYVARVVTGRR